MIKDIFGLQVFDSRGEPTIKCFVKTEKGIFSACVPSGASKGKHEAYELRDHKKDYFGKGVENAVKNIKKLKKFLVGKDEREQEEIDALLLKLDGTENKRKFGANTILSISLAICKAGAVKEGLPLYKYLSEKYQLKIKIPYPLFNVINGGLHIGEKGIQEHLIIPMKKKFKENLKIGVEIYSFLKKEFKEKFGYSGILVGDEGGFAPKINKVEDRLEFILKAAEELGYNKDIFLGIDVAASNLYKKGKYFLEGKVMSAKETIDYYKNLTKKYPLIYLEDPLQEEDWENWKVLKKELSKIWIVGDDLLVTNKKRILKASKEKACNGMILKVNQIGTLSEGVEAGKLGLLEGWKVFVSHRSGETCDRFIADLSCNFGFLKAGAPARGERVSKYNRILEIEELGI